LLTRLSQFNGYILAAGAGKQVMRHGGSMAAKLPGVGRSNSLSQARIRPPLRESFAGR